MIKMVDKDGDGQVSFDEFYAMVTKESSHRPDWASSQHRQKKLEPRALEVQLPVLRPSSCVTSARWRWKSSRVITASNPKA